MKVLSSIFLSIGLMVTTLMPVSGQAEPSLNGLAVHSELGKEQFIAALYTSSPSKDPKTILLNTGEKRIQVKIVAERLSSRRFKRLWIEGMAINASAQELKAHSQNMANFSNFLKIKLLAGDVFTVDRTAKSTTVALNGSILGVIEDGKFFDILLRSWIGPVPLSSDFREGLLTGGKLDSTLETRYANTQPGRLRIQFVEDSLKPSEPPEPAPEIAIETTPEPEEDEQLALVSPPQIVPPAVVAAPPKPEVAEQATPTATPLPTSERRVAKAPPRPSLLDESLLDEEEEDIEFTAAGLLAESLYISKLKRWTNRHIKYPSRALDKGWEGNVRLLITIDRNGEVQATTVTEKPRYKDLEKAALKAVKKANPFPAMPEEVRGDNFKFTLPIVFVLRL